MLDSGSNEEFQKAEDYLAIGAKVGVKLKLPTVPIVEAATLTTEYRFMHTYSITDKSFDNFEVSLD